MSDHYYPEGPWEYYDESDEEDIAREEYEYEHACRECGEPGEDECCCCGTYLCYMHHEVQCGFCSGCPTESWIAEQEAGL
jgi:hypothetical protein